MLMVLYQEITEFVLFLLQTKMNNVTRRPCFDLQRLKTCGDVWATTGILGLCLLLF